MTTTSFLPTTTLTPDGTLPAWEEIVTTPTAAPTATRCPTGISILLWMLSTSLAFRLVRVVFDAHPYLGRRRRNIGIFLAWFVLTAEIIQTEMTEMRLAPFSPLASAMWISLFYAILADMGLQCLITMGMVATTMHVRWIVDNWQLLREALS